MEFSSYVRLALESVKAKSITLLRICQSRALHKDLYPLYSGTVINCTLLQVLRNHLHFLKKMVSTYIFFSKVDCKWWQMKGSNLTTVDTSMLPNSSAAWCVAILNFLSTKACCGGNYKLCHCSHVPTSWSDVLC